MNLLSAFKHINPLNYNIFSFMENPKKIEIFETLYYNNCVNIIIKCSRNIDRIID